MLRWWKGYVENFSLIRVIVWFLVIFVLMDLIPFIKNRDFSITSFQRFLIKVIITFVIVFIVDFIVYPFEKYMFKKFKK
ncbi:MAG: hypothetical protein CBR30_05300 [Dictyoglomus sp. NZ13-RE01]|nr:MAG: hypothetical protein CBR30_05300 [Dictyoglomus sp. NZ13-RE01]